jgi:hypothetical protein
LLHRALNENKKEVAKRILFSTAFPPSFSPALLRLVRDFGGRSVAARASLAAFERRSAMSEHQTL